MPLPAYDATDKNCCICFDGFDNGDGIVVLCLNQHVVCASCACAWPYTHPLVCQYCSPQSESVGVVEYAEELEVDFLEPEEILPCPVCRDPANVLCLFKSQNYYPGTGTATSPINVD